MKTIKTYSELMQFETFQERFEYLKLDSNVGQPTFGFDRFINQDFYHSQEWRNIRDRIIVRDYGCDLAVPGYDLQNEIYIHHMNPVLLEDIINYTEYLTNPEYLISCSRRTHNAIHYGNRNVNVDTQPIIRTPGDTTPWKRRK